MNKNILHIFASVASWGGGEQYVFDLAKKQIAEGCRLTLLSADSDIIQAKIKTLQCNTAILKNRGRFNPFSIAKVRRIILRYRIETVHIHLFKDAFIAVFAAKFISPDKRPTIIMTRHLVKKGKGNLLYRWLYRKLDKLIFVSELAKNEFLQGVPTLPDNKTIVIHNSITESMQTGQSMDYRAHFGLDRECLLIGFVGRLVEYKGVEMLIDIAQKLRNRNIAFFLAGKGDKKYELFLKNTINEKQLETKFFLLGFLENTMAFIEKMDIGLLPSLWREPFGLSILEFMSAGVPVITSNTGAQPEFIIHEETGLLVAPKLEAMTAALVKLLDDENLRKSIGKQAQAFYKQHLNYEIFFNRIMDVYEHRI
jgi:glycosyltransferase involved in cell wall biosynthesis